MTDTIITLTYEDGSIDKVTIDDEKMLTWDKKPGARSTELMVTLIDFIVSIFESYRALGLAKLTMAPPPQPPPPGG